MYKISEEDSQDEEVLNSLSTKVSGTLNVTGNNDGSNNNNVVNVPLRVKPIPPAKPAFLRKALVTGFGGVGNNIRNNQPPSHSNNDGNFVYTGSNANRAIHSTSSSDAAKTRHPTAIAMSTSTAITIDPASRHLEWPSSTETQTGESDNDSGEVSVCSEGEATAASLRTPQPLLQLSYKKTKRHKRRGENTRTHNESIEDNDSTQSDQSFCSSCDERQSDHGPYDASDDDNGSYYDDHPESGSDIDFDSESDTLFEEELASLLTEAEIQSWSSGDGNVLLCEYVSATNGPEISESANEKSGLHSKSKSIPSSSYSSTASGTPEIEIGSGVQDNSKGKKGTKGKISRLLKRGSKSKQKKGGRDELSKIDSRSSKSNNSTTLLTESTEKEISKNMQKPGANKVFRFKDEHEGEIRTVELFIRSYSKHNLGRRATMVEALLGIVPSRFSSKTASDRSNSFGSISSKKETEDKRIMVAGFIPDGPAARNKQIKIGDWLQRVNGIFVDFSNANSVLLQILQQESDSFESPLKISLELQRVSGYTVTDNVPTKTVTFGDLVQDGGNSTTDRPLRGLKPTDYELPSEIMSKIAMIYISVVNTTPPLSVPKEKTKDVIFAWPAESESRKVKALAASHGMFSTLYKLLKDVTGSHPVLCRVMIDEEEMDVVFSSDDEGKGLLLLATATVLSNFNICHSTIGESNSRKEKKLRWKDPVDGGLSLAQRLMTRVELLLKFQFGSLSRAFRNTPEEKLHHFFMEALSGLSDISEDFLFPQVPDFFLRIPPRIRCSIDERLYSFETSDSFTLCYGQSSTEFEKPLFNCLGSCLYYKQLETMNRIHPAERPPFASEIPEPKGMAVSSHMERKLASHFHGCWRTQLGLWSVKRNTLPYLWEPVKRLVLWQETFIFENVNENQEENLADKNSLPSVQQCCSVIVGIGNYMLGMILEPATPENRVLKPDTGWIQRGFNCVLRILKSEIHPSLERWILSQEKEFIELYPPPGSGNKTFLSGTKTSTHFSSSIAPLPGPSGILKNADQVPVVNPNVNPTTSASVDFTNVGGLGVPQQMENINTITSPSPQETIGPLAQPSEPQSSLHDYSYHYGLSTSNISAERLEMSYGSNDEDELEETTTTGTGSDTSSLKWCLDESNRFNESPIDEEIKTVSITKGNVLFDFLQVEAGRCVLLSSKDTLEGPLSVVVHNFRQSATLTHHILHKAANGRIRLSRQLSDKKWVSKALTPISEHGVLFNCDVVDPRDVHKKKPRLRQVSYWVIGRMYPNQREVYICYQDSSVAQNLIEVAFKLAYYSV